MLTTLPRRRRGAATRLVMTAALASAAIVPLTQARAAAPVPLTATTVLTGPGYADVSLPKPLKLKDAVAALRVKQPLDAFGGLALVRNQRAPRPPGIAVVRTGSDGSVLRYVWLGTTDGTIAAPGQRDNGTYGTRTLPAGTYRLALAGKGPLSATWMLPGLQAKTTALRLTGTPAFLTSRDNAPSVGGAVSSPASAVSVAFTSNTPYALASSLSWKLTAATSAGVGGCLNDTNNAVTNVDMLAAPVPHCVNGDSETGTVGIAAGPDPTGQVTAYAKPGSWFFKAYAYVGGAATEITSSLLAIDLGPAFSGG
jgi:hypothetical protein